MPIRLAIPDAPDSPRIPAPPHSLLAVILESRKVRTMITVQMLDFLLPAIAIKPLILQTHQQSAAGAGPFLKT